MQLPEGHTKTHPTYVSFYPQRRRVLSSVIAYGRPAVPNDVTAISLKFGGMMHNTTEQIAI